MKDIKEDKIKYDSIEKYGNGSLLHHGKHNNRVYLMYLHPADIKGISKHISDIARTYRYTKICCKIPAWAAPYFLSEGYFIEAHIPGYYQNNEAVFFMSKFLNSDRLIYVNYNNLKGLHCIFKNNKSIQSNVPAQPDKFIIQKLDINNAFEISKVFETVFKSYPFPYHDPEYIRHTMDNGNSFYGAIMNEGIVAVAAMKINLQDKNAELKDFATLPICKNLNLENQLLKYMEQKLNTLKIQNIHERISLNNMDLNKTFIKNKYSYSGTLINNAHIDGSIESINVLYKSLCNNVTN